MGVGYLMWYSEYAKGHITRESGFISGHSGRLFTLSHCLGWLYVPNNLTPGGYRGLFEGGKWLWHRLSSHLHSVLVLRAF